MPFGPLRTFFFYTLPPLDGRNGSLSVAVLISAGVDHAQDRVTFLPTNTMRDATDSHRYLLVATPSPILHPLSSSLPLLLASVPELQNPTAIGLQFNE